MATVQNALLSLCQAICPRTAEGQVLQSSAGASTITNVENNGSGLCRVTAANHGLKTGHRGYITGVTWNGTPNPVNNTASNPNWAITRIDANTVDLVGSTFSGSYTSGGTMTGALVGSVDAARITRQRYLDIWNQARFAAFGILEQVIPRKEFSRYVSDVLIFKENLAFDASGGVSRASKPTGYIRAKGSILDASGYPIILLDANLKQTVQEARNPDFLQSDKYRFAFEIGSEFVHYGTYVAIASTYKLLYHGLTTYTLSDVLGGSTTEQFNDEHQWKLIEIGQAIAAEQGILEINALAKRLFARQEA